MGVNLTTMGIRKKLVLMMLVTSVVFLIAVIGLLIPLFRWNLSSSLAIQQQTLLTALQTEIDTKVASALKQLTAVAGVVPAEVMNGSQDAQVFLADRVGIGSIFDIGLEIYTVEGQRLAATGKLFGGVSADKQTPFIHNSLEEPSPRIDVEARYCNRKHCHPVAQFSAPIRGDDGTLLGFLCGGICLDGQNLIGGLARYRIGKTGYLYLYAQDRTILVHPDSDRIMKKDVPPGSNVLFDKAIDGWQGTDFTINSQGLRTFSSFKPLKNVPWILASNYPEDEALVPARRVTGALVVIITVLGGLAMAITWVGLRSVTGPLAALTDHLRRFDQWQDAQRKITLQGHLSSEIKQLEEGFNHMLQVVDLQRDKIAEKVETLRRQTQQLESEVLTRQQAEQQLLIASERHQDTARLLQHICDNVPDLIWAKDLQHQYIFTNKANCHTLLGVDSTAAVIGKNHEFFADKILKQFPEDPLAYQFSELCCQSDNDVLRTRQSMRFQEVGFVKGTLICLDVYKAPFYDADGALIGTVGSARIITREKQLEQETIRLSRLYRILSAVNQHIVHKPQPIELFEFVCDTLLEDATFTMAWIGLPNENGIYKPVVSSGISLDILGEPNHCIHNNGQLSHLTTDITAETAQNVLCPTGYRLYQRSPFQAVASFPIQPEEAAGALLVVYAQDKKLLEQDDEQQLLDELVQDVAFALDVHEREQQQAFSMKQLQLAATVFDNSQEGIVLTDQNEKILSVNRAFTEITGYRDDEILGQTPRILKSDRHGRDFYQKMWRCLKEHGSWQGEIWNRRKDGQVYPELMSISAVSDEQHQISHYIALFSDISQAKESQQKLDYLAWHDPLTDLPNRSLFCSHLDQATKSAQRNHRSFAVLCFDLDHFKDVNDSFGHLVGDALLKKVADRLRSRLRESDMLARLGGDEFVLLLEDSVDSNRVTMMAEEILHLLQQPICLTETDLEVQVSVSIGIAVYPEHGRDALELLQRADSALYRAKQHGRARFAYYNEEMTEQAQERVQLSFHLRQALEKQEFAVYYQPQVDLKTGQIIGAEALMRWNSPELGMVTPDRFIPLAEEIGCICPMGNWILRRVCEQGKAWLDAGYPPLILAVNLSAVQFAEEDIARRLKEILDQTGYPAEYLELEVTESTLMHKEQQTIDLLQSLNALGVRLALDDFGTGYSSLAYLKYFPLHLLKVDKSFVDDLPLDANDCKMVTAIVQMGHGLGFDLLAEGVETEAQREYLAQLGCDYYQGYYCSPPVPACDFATLRQRQKRS